jgi:hypothetical protein
VEPSRFDLGKVLDASILAHRVATDGDWEARGEGAGWRASSLGSCPRGQVIGRLIPTTKVFDVKTLRTFALGNLLGDWVVHQFDIAGILLAKEVPYRASRFDIAGHADALVRWEPKDPDGPTVGVEVKTANSNSMKYRVDEGPQQDHMLQVGAYMLMAEDGDLAQPGYRAPDAWVLTYLGKDYAGMLTFDADYTWKAMAVAQLVILNEAWTNRSLPPCTCTSAYGGTGPFYCSYLDREQDVKLVASVGQATSRAKKDLAPKVRCCARSKEGLAAVVAAWKERTKADA